MSDILHAVDSQGIATITLNRPDRHNAFDDALLKELRDTIRAFGQNRKVRVVVLGAAGKSFSAGADLNWMRRMAGYSEQENYQDALAMAEFFMELATLPKPVVGCVQGPALGGGVGLVAACDIVVAAESAWFSLSEVKIGLIPAVVSPYIIRAIGDRAARRYSLTGERFSAAEALQLGLIDTVVEASDLSTGVSAVCRTLLGNSPAAMAAVKTKLSFSTAADMREQGIYTAKCIAEIRVSKEGQEGLAAFLEKRKPSWVND
jgi:methylglutaconyl-CoA hydratase